MKNSFLINMTPNYGLEEIKLNEQDKASIKISSKRELFLWSSSYR